VMGTGPASHSLRATPKTGSGTTTTTACGWLSCGSTSCNTRNGRVRAGRGMPRHGPFSCGTTSSDRRENFMQTRRRLVRVLLLTLALQFGGVPAGWGNEGSPKGTLDATEHEFRRVPRGTVITTTFVIHNTGAAPLQIESMQFSTPGMRARVAPTIAPGSSTELKIEWDTSHYTRDAEGQVALMVNDPATPRVVLTLTGFVVSPIDVEPVPAFYLSQFQGEGSAQTVTMRNNRERELKITATERQGNKFTLAIETV